MKKILLAGLLIVLAAMPALYAGPVSMTSSTVSFVATQMNVPVEGKFTKFSGDIQFDPAKPAAGRANIEIDTSTIDLGDEEFNGEMRRKPWLDVKTYPKAMFVSSSIKQLAPDKLEVKGKLTIKGTAKDVTVPVTVKTEGAGRVFEGALPVKRLAFNIGEGSWTDTSVVADDVQIKFRLLAANK